jgi:hypothetical protein
MVSNSILARFSGFSGFLRSRRPNLHSAFLSPRRLPDFVSDCPPAMRMLDLLGPLSWGTFPERNLHRNWGHTTTPHAAFSAACLLKLNENLVSMGDLRQYLIEHPAFIWLLGFPLKPSIHHACGFDPQASLPTERHLTRMLREMPSASVQFLLDESVRLLLGHFAMLGFWVGECISLDTKHILAWVQENNPKAYVETRFDKTKQPKGDHDCKLGCKRRHNQRTSKPSQPATPSTLPIPADTISVGEFYWGYGSGVVVVKVPDYGEFVLAEMTQTFDHPDVSYFFPLMAKTEQILGFKPRFGTFDAAFDAWYVYDYFHRTDDPQAFAAVPFSEKGGYKAKGRQFSPEGLPICPAGLTMPLQFTYPTTPFLSFHMSAANMFALYVSRNQVNRPAQSTMKTGKRKAVQLPCLPASEPGCAIPLTGKARPTKTFTASAPLWNASTARLMLWGLSARIFATEMPSQISTR